MNLNKSINKNSTKGTRYFLLGSKKLTSRYRRRLDLEKKLYPRSLTKTSILKKFGKKLRKHSPQTFNNVLDWFNDLSNVNVAMIVLFTMTAMFFLVHYFFTPAIEVTSVTVSNILAQWDYKVSMASAYTTGWFFFFMYKVAWLKYEKKVQGRVGQ